VEKYPVRDGGGIGEADPCLRLPTSSNRTKEESPRDFYAYRLPLFNPSTGPPDGTVHQR